jgi:hypothetical protein
MINQVFRLLVENYQLTGYGSGKKKLRLTTTKPSLEEWFLIQ